MSAVGGKADVACLGLSGPFIAKTGHSRFIKQCRTLAHCDAFGWAPSTASGSDLIARWRACNRKTDRALPQVYVAALLPTGHR